jgi:hypothetical protein
VSARLSGRFIYGLRVKRIVSSSVVVAVVVDRNDREKNADSPARAINGPGTTGE